jgi:hypothetical protein
VELLNVVLLSVGYCQSAFIITQLKHWNQAVDAYRAQLSQQLIKDFINANRPTQVVCISYSCRHSH